MAEDARNRQGDVFSAAGKRTVNGEEYDPANPRHRRYLEMPGGSPDGPAASWHGDRHQPGEEDYEVVSVTSDQPATYGGAGEVVHNVSAGADQHVRAGRHSEVTPGDQVIIRRSS